MDADEDQSREHLPRGSRTGGVGFTQIADGLSIMRRLQRIRGGIDSSVVVPWEELSPFVVDRGRVKIFPLARASAARDSAEELEQLKASLQNDCIHHFGGDWMHRETTLDADGGYGRVLAKAGIATRAPVYAWQVGDLAAALVHAEEKQDGGSSLALHIVPRDWIWYRSWNAGTKREESRERRIARQRSEADPTWEWPVAE